MLADKNKPKISNRRVCVECVDNKKYKVKKKEKKHHARTSEGV